MSSMPLVSVIVPFFNTGRFIQEAIESVFAQTYEKWELLLVDDGSTDNSTQIALKVAAQYPGKVRYMEHHGHLNRGASASRNLGINHAKGDILAFLDSDDVWLPHKLHEQVAILDSHPEATVLYGNTQNWYSWAENTTDSQRDFVPDLAFQTDSVVKPPTLLMRNYPLGKGEAPSFSNLVLRREVVDRIGGFEDRFKRVYTDQAFVTKVYLTEPVFVAGERPYWDKYRRHPDSACSVMWSTGRYWPVREDFLAWFEGYLREKQIHDSEVWRLLREAQLEAQLKVHRQDLRKYKEQLQNYRTKLRNHDTRLKKLERALKQQRRKTRRLRRQVLHRGEQAPEGWRPLQGRLWKKFGYLRARLKRN